MSTLPTATQRDALTHAIASTGRLVYLTGGWWTTEAHALEVARDNLRAPTWSVTRGTVVACEARGWLRAESDHRDAPRVVTDEGMALAPQQTPP